MDGGSCSGDGDLDARSNAQPSISSKEVQQIQADVDKLVSGMQVLRDKVLEREEKLSELEKRVDALPTGAEQFEKVSKKDSWKNLKCWNNS